MSYYVGIKKEYISIAKSIYEDAGFSVEVFPYTKKGLTQSKWAKLRITNLGRTIFEKAKNSKKLQNSEINKYIEEW